MIYSRNRRYPSSGRSASHSAGPRPVPGRSASPALLLLLIYIAIMAAVIWVFSSLSDSAHGATIPVPLNYGAAAGDGTGDGLRTTFSKIQTNFNRVWFPIYWQTNAADVFATNAALSLLGKGVGTNVITPFTNSHRAYRIFASGFIGTANTAPVASNLTFAVTIGPNSYTGSSFTLSNSMANSPWSLDAILFAPSLIAGTTLADYRVHLRWTMNGTNNGPFNVYGAYVSTGQSVDTSTNNLIDLTAQFGSNNATNGIECRELLIEQCTY